VKILPTKYFVWMEPKPFLAASDEFERSKRRWWHRPLFVLIITVNCCALVWLQLLVAKSRHPARELHTDLPTILGVVVGIVFVACLFAYVLPWIVTKCPSRITIHDRFLQRSRGDRSPQIPFKNLASFSLHSGPEFSTLVLAHRRGRQIFIGVPHDVPADKLSAFLSERIPADEPNG
jgi:hypothetical protein